MKRILPAALPGGIAMFLWSSVAHILLPLGEIGIGEIPNEAPVLAALQSVLGSNGGMYIYRGTGVGPNGSPAEKQAHIPEYPKKLAANPSGLPIYRQLGAEALAPRQLLSNSAANCSMLSWPRCCCVGRQPIPTVLFVTMAVVLAALPINISYWNWYGVPCEPHAAYMLTLIAGFLCAGLVAAKIVRGAKPV